MLNTNGDSIIEHRLSCRWNSSARRSVCPSFQLRYLTTPCSVAEDRQDNGILTNAAAVLIPVSVQKFIQKSSMREQLRRFCYQNLHKQLKSISTTYHFRAISWETLKQLLESTLFSTCTVLRVRRRVTERVDGVECAEECCHPLCYLSIGGASSEWMTTKQFYCST